MPSSPARWMPLPPHIRALAAANPGSILLETSRFDASNHHSFLFQHPIQIIAVHNLSDLPHAFAQIESALAEGLYVAGYFSYECGYHFENHPAPAPADLPFAWIGLYRDPLVFDHAQPQATAPTAPEDIALHNLTLDIEPDQYAAAIHQIQRYIAAGETYQVNFTSAVSFRTQASAAALYQSLQQRQSVAYGALLHVAGHHILSFSPELFFRTDGSRIVTRPMKGTMPRGLDPAEDAAAALRLRHDEKNRSEHVMIVDLLRNDLGRICTLGSVHVEDIFSVETYQTLLQMTSTVAGALRPGVSYYEIFRAMFPSGSITGAPKIRTMQIIRSLERAPRGVYTGAIGYFAPNGASAFNVAIRTLILRDGHARMGVGGGIVADSDPVSEYNECLLKAAFLTRPRPPFQLIETMLWLPTESQTREEFTSPSTTVVPGKPQKREEIIFSVSDTSFGKPQKRVPQVSHLRPGNDAPATDTSFGKPQTRVPQVSPLRPGYDAHATTTVPGDPPHEEFHLLDLHLDRLQSSATYFNFVFDRDEVFARLQALAASLPPQPHRIRLLLHANGELTLEHAHFTPDARPISVRLSPHRTSSGDVFLRHKTTHRALYDEQLTAARAAGFDEVLFLNERGELTEGAISNLFIERAGKLLTPPLASGVLPGIFRRHLLQSDPSAAEKVLTLADLQTAEAIYLCSSLRGLREVDRLILHS